MSHLSLKIPHPLAPSPASYIGQRQSSVWLERGRNIERGLRPLSLAHSRYYLTPSFPLSVNREGRE